MRSTLRHNCNRELASFHAVWQLAMWKELHNPIALHLTRKCRAYSLTSENIYMTFLAVKDAHRMPFDSMQSSGACNLFSHAGFWGSVALSQLRFLSHCKLRARTMTNAKICLCNSSSSQGDLKKFFLSWFGYLIVWHHGNCWLRSEPDGSSLFEPVHWGHAIF